ncbi:hypothetical protein Taro_008190, partial [Colocasia esculenta]|nr:hypothetical protein [Colocasia esculenta]
LGEGEGKAGGGFSPYPKWPSGLFRGSPARSVHGERGGTTPPPLPVLTHQARLSLQRRRATDRSARGGGIEPDNCLSWLAPKESSSVVYVCFESLCRFIATQLCEIALGLEILLLNHEAVGGYVTHCGWNSCLEWITAGLPTMVWPMSTDQFDNEQLQVQMLEVGVSMGGTKQLNTLREEERPLVGAKEVAGAVKVLMGGGGGEMQWKARELKEAARAAMREGVSSYDDMGHLIEELLGK